MCFSHQDSFVYILVIILKHVRSVFSVIVNVINLFNALKEKVLPLLLLFKQFHHFPVLCFHLDVKIFVKEF